MNLYPRWTGAYKGVILGKGGEGGFTAFQKCIRDWLLMKTSYPRKKEVPVTNGDVDCNIINVAIIVIDVVF